jgi:hypothetical protein
MMSVTCFAFSLGIVLNIDRCQPGQFAGIPALGQVLTSTHFQLGIRVEI